MCTPGHCKSHNSNRNIAEYNISFDPDSATLDKLNPTPRREEPSSSSSIHTSRVIAPRIAAEKIGETPSMHSSDAAGIVMPIGTPNPFSINKSPVEQTGVRPTRIRQPPQRLTYTPKHMNKGGKRRKN